ncbi:MAG: rhodanese-like domain-containing protein, partial [Synechococcus sp.]|nr:rhodanese-like domain-containing protein [Synechococcus sp.]
QAGHAAEAADAGEHQPGADEPGEQDPGGGDGVAPDQAQLHQRAGGDLPLPELDQRSGEIPSGKPVVVVCHSGSRSALATQQLLKAGHSQVANLRGGLARWGDEGYPLEVAVT